MRRYRPLRKANVHIITNDFKKVFYGMRTLYIKGLSTQKYIRYKNRYYPAYYDGYHTYNARIKRWYNARVLFSDWTPR